MPAPDPRHRTQEQSIKARKHQLFETDEDHPHAEARRSFAQCLRDTPAAPLTPPLKMGLWAVGVLVILLLLVALFQSVNRKPRPQRRPAAAAALPGRGPRFSAEGLDAVGGAVYTPWTLTG